MEDKVLEALDEIRSRLQADGGDIELVGITDDGVVKVRMLGMCAGCPGAARTIKNIVERAVMDLVPEVKSVENVG